MPFIFLLIMAFIVYNIIVNISRRMKESIPKITTDACTRGKREDTKVYTDGATLTTYIVVFEVNSTEMEFQVKAGIYNKIPENTCGKLTYKESRFLRFEYNGKIVF